MAGEKTYVESAQDALKSATDTVGSYAQSAKESIVGGVSCVAADEVLSPVHQTTSKHSRPR